MTDTKQICEAIKGLPDNDRLQLHVRPTYKSDEWGMNRYLTTESDASIATDDLKALVAENERFGKILGTAQKAAKLFADTLPPKGGQAIARDLLETINETLATHGGNDD